MWSAIGRIVARSHNTVEVELTKEMNCLALGRPYHISYGCWQDSQFVEDVAQMILRCLEAPYSGAKAYNLRGDVFDLPAFHAAMCHVDQ